MCELPVIRFRLTGAMTPAERAAAEALLDAPERRRCAALRVDADRRDYAAAHALLRMTLSSAAPVDPADWTFEADARGKPGIPAASSLPPLAFSLSHSRGVVACAVARVPVGVDVEQIDRNVEVVDLSSRYFAPGEAAQVSRGPLPQARLRFTELWTLKEAYAKALGLGLSHGLDATAFDLDADERTIHGGAPGWTFALFEPAPGARLAVAIEGEGSLTVRQEGGPRDVRPLRTSR